MGRLNQLSEKIRQTDAYKLYYLDGNTGLAGTEQYFEMAKKELFKFPDDAAITKDDAAAFKAGLPETYKPDYKRIDEQAKTASYLRDEEMNYILGKEMNPVSRAFVKAGLEPIEAYKALGLFIWEDSGFNIDGVSELKNAALDVPFDAEKFKKYFDFYGPHMITAMAKESEKHMAALKENAPNFQPGDIEFMHMYREMADHIETLLDPVKDKLFVKPGWNRAIYEEEQIEEGNTRNYNRAVSGIKEFKKYSDKIADGMDIKMSPLAEQVDINALKEVPSDVVMELANKHFIDKNKEKLADSSGLENAAEYLKKASADSSSAWRKKINSFFNTGDDEILIQSEDGITETLKASRIEELAETGKRFYAIPKSKLGTDVRPALCQPDTDGKLLVDSEIAKKYNGFNVMKGDYFPKAPEMPGSAVFVLDSIISSIGNIFGKNWRLESVVKYEHEQEQYLKASRITREIIKTGAGLGSYTSPEKMGYVNEVFDLSSKGVAPDDAKFAVDFKNQIDSASKDLQEAKTFTPEHLASAMVLNLYEDGFNKEYAKLQDPSKERQLERAVYGTIKRTLTPEKFFNGQKNLLLKNPVFQEEAGKLSQDDLKAMCERPVKSGSAAKLLNFSRQLRNAEAAKVHEEHETAFEKSFSVDPGNLSIK